MEKIEKKRFKKNLVDPETVCAWCYKQGMWVVATAKAVRLTCKNNCGFYAWQPISYLTPKQKRLYFPKPRVWRKKNVDASNG